MEESATTDASDAALLASAARGHEAAFASLYDRHAPALLALLRRMLRDGSAAEEALQESFVQAWRQAERFEPARGTVLSWLYTICRTRALDRLRAGRRRGAAETASQGGRDRAALSPTTPEASSIKSERAVAVRRALGALSDGEREAIELAYFDGLSRSEIAARLGVPTGTVKSRIAAAVAKMRSVVDPALAEAPAQSASEVDHGRV